MSVQQKEVYITKYLFTQGIQKRLVRDHGCFKQDVEDNWCSYYPKEYHDTWEDALTCAEIMKAKKISSLEKQLKKVRAMEFRAKKKAKESNGS
jgi:hypothetical protein